MTQTSPDEGEGIIKECWLQSNRDVTRYSTHLVVASLEKLTSKSQLLPVTIVICHTTVVFEPCWFNNTEQ